MPSDDRARPRSRMLLALGLFAPACASTPSSSSPTVAASSSSSAAPASTSDDGPTIVGDANDPPPNGNEVACGVAYTKCMPAGEKGQSSYPPPYDACAYDYYGDGEYYDQDRFSIRETKRARTKGDAEACCYRLQRNCYNNGGYNGPPVPGRPLRDASSGENVVARPRAREDWSFAVGALALSSISAEVRGALAASWLDDAAEEHASIAAFSVVSLQLLSLGAPADLLVGVHEAAADEIDHARLSYALASAYADLPRGPSSLDVARAAIHADVVRFARETFRDGCFGETAASLRAREGARLAQDPVVAALLGRIADDEERHAELAWRMLAWAMRAGGSAVVESLREEARELGFDPDDDAPGEALDLSAHGVLSRGARAAIDRAAIDDVVVPCLRALVDSYAPAAATTVTAP